MRKLVRIRIDVFDGPTQTELEQSIDRDFNVDWNPSTESLAVLKMRVAEQVASLLQP